MLGTCDLTDGFILTSKKLRTTYASFLRYIEIFSIAIFFIVLF